MFCYFFNKLFLFFKSFVDFYKHRPGSSPTVCGRRKHFPMFPLREPQAVGDCYGIFNVRRDGRFGSRSTTPVGLNARLTSRPSGRYCWQLA